jgi:thioredoxin reductase (NADPH)
MSNHYGAIVLGAGPAGLTAAIYLSRSRVDTLVIDEHTPGGQMIMSHIIANYPGAPDIAGGALARTMLKQAKSFGCRVITQSKVVSLDLESVLKTVEVEDEGVFTADSVIIATGGVPRTLGMESEKKFQGTGISYCATCDGEFFTGKEIVAIGGGNTALEEAVSLSKYASKVTVVHVFNDFQAHPWAVEEAKNTPGIEFLLNQRVEMFKGDTTLEKVVCVDKTTDKTTEIDAAGCFVFIGYIPNTAHFKGLINMNDKGEILAGDDMSTNIKGVYVAGDNRQKKFRQITTAVADGTIAALSASEYINSLK